jgi:hypothetical protein
MTQTIERGIRNGVFLLLFLFFHFPGCAEVKKSDNIPFPQWGSPGSKNWPARFQTDLDLLAPLGKGTKNAAVWFKDFFKYQGPRWKEFWEARIEGGKFGRIGRMDPQHPLLLEAEPWCDQAKFQLYPEIFPIEGKKTKVITLFVPLVLANSWINRGNACKNPADALEDYQRVVRLGRLWRRDDVFIYSDLGGLECIHKGARAIYDLAIRTGDYRLATAAAVTLSEIVPQQVLTAKRLDSLNIYSFVRQEGPKHIIDLPGPRFSEILRMARSDPDRRFRLEAIDTLIFIINYGKKDQVQESSNLLLQLSQSKDVVIARIAHWALKEKPGIRALEERGRPQGGTISFFYNLFKHD